MPRDHLITRGSMVMMWPHQWLLDERSRLGPGIASLLSRWPLGPAQNQQVASSVFVADFSCSPALLKRFEMGQAGCSAHARRPFERYKHEDPVMCTMMLDQVNGLQLLEEGLDTVGRNAENVALVRETRGREIWQVIQEIADLMAENWSQRTKLGEAARYVQRNQTALERYLGNPRLPWTNNGSERALRPEKQIESSSLFRMTLEGRFVLDILRRTIGLSRPRPAAGGPRDREHFSQPGHRCRNLGPYRQRTH